MSACSPLLMQMSAAGPLVPAAPSTFVDARARFEGALELRPGRNIECSFRPQEKDAKAPTVFLVPRGGSTAEEEFGAPFVAELSKTVTVATMACDADADEAARDLYEFFKRYSGDSTNRTGQDKGDSTSLQRECSARARSEKSIHASKPFREMIARPKISRNEWKTAEIGAFEVGNFALLCCPANDAP